MGHKETVKDTARVLGRMYDAIEYRGFAQETAEELARWSGVPVYNGLTDEWHPTQILADFLTFLEHVPKPLNEVVFCYLGDARFNMADSYLIGAAKLGMDVRVCSPSSLRPRDEIVDQARAVAEETGATITVSERSSGSGSWLRRPGHRRLGVDGRAGRGVGGADQAALPVPGQCRGDGRHGQPGREVHALPPRVPQCRHAVGREIADKFGLEALEVTEEVFESPASVVFDKAENRLHTIKAVLVATLAGSSCGLSSPSEVTRCCAGANP